MIPGGDEGDIRTLVPLVGYFRGQTNPARLSAAIEFGTDLRSDAVPAIVVTGTPSLVTNK